LAERTSLAIEEKGGDVVQVAILIQKVVPAASIHKNG
jgi:hypothetical protein